MSDGEKLRHGDGAKNRATRLQRYWVALAILMAGASATLLWLHASLSDNSAPGVSGSTLVSDAWVVLVEHLPGLGPLSPSATLWLLTLAALGAFGMLVRTLLVPSDIICTPQSVVGTGNSPPALSRPWRAAPMWRLGSLLVAVFVAGQLGACDLWRAVPASGGNAWLPNTFASVDHPFHIARAETVRRYAAEGTIPRWLDDHQGGYPAEFYPLGVAWLEVAAWSVGGGVLPIPVIHKLVVIAIFLLPGLAFTMWAHRDGLSPSVGLIAFALHVLVAGGDFQGGYTELIHMGLVTNVAAAVASLFALVYLTNYAAHGRGRDAALASAMSAAAVWCNPRSLMGLAAIGIATLAASSIRGRRIDLDSGARSLNRVATVAALGFLLAAPELVSLARFRELYHLVIYSQYDTMAAFLKASLQAVSLPVCLLGLAGAAIGWRRDRFGPARVAAAALVLQLLLTWLANSPLGSVLAPQLESVRMMPMQRFLTIYLAAVMVQALIDRVASAVTAIPWRHQLLAVAAVIPLLVAVVRPGLLLSSEQNPYAPVVMSATPQMADFIDATRSADTLSPPGTAILVLGSANSTHQQLWAPIESSRPFFYDDWLWYWQTEHSGSDDPQWQLCDPSSGAAWRRDCLERHAIGAVLATGDVRTSAAMSADLVHQAVGSSDAYDVYAVRNPTLVVEFPGGAPARVSLSLHHIHAAGRSAGGTTLVRRNWFPRWRAELNGTRVPLARTVDGYMSVLTPAGAMTLDLFYDRDLTDWTALVGSGAGLAIAVWLISTRQAVYPPNREA